MDMIPPSHLPKAAHVIWQRGYGKRVRRLKRSQVRPTDGRGACLLSVGAADDGMMATADGRASTPCTPITGPRFLAAEKSGLLGSALLRERARSAHSLGEAARLAEAVATLEAENTQLQAQVQLRSWPHLSLPVPLFSGDVILSALLFKLQSTDT